MKKWLILLLVLAVLAGAACAYWFGYQWYLERGWEAAAERLEAQHDYLDVVCVEYFAGEQLNIWLDPIGRQFAVEKETYTPYVLIAFEFVGDESPDDEETLRFLNNCLEEGKRITGRNTQVVIMALGNTGTYYVASMSVVLHSANPPTDVGQVQFMPMWFVRFPNELILFPGRPD